MEVLVQCATVAVVTMTWVQCVGWSWAKKAHKIIIIIDIKKLQQQKLFTHSTGEPFESH